MEDDLEISKLEHLSNHILDHAKILNLSLNDLTIFLNTQNKKTSKGRQIQNIKSLISQQPLIGSCSNVKLKLK
jgi:hypothetical protein